MKPSVRLVLFAFFLLPSLLKSAIIPVGSGSYTTIFPGRDVAGRNGFPPGTPQLSGSAVDRPVPTNDWWSALLNNNHAGNLFNYPLGMRTLPEGLNVGLVEPVSGVNGSSQPLSDINPVIIGVSGLASTRATVDDYSDWTVTIAWSSNGHSFKAKSGIGMPFVYFSKGASDVASVRVNVGTVAVSGATLIITNSQGGANFAVYAPSGSSWVQNGNVYTSSLAGKNYWSMAILPDGSPATNAAAWRAHAFVEPMNTAVNWSYSESTSTLRCEYVTTVSVREGAGTTIVQGLLPHQWGNLASDAPTLSGISLPTIRGEMKLLMGNAFATERTFHGILPTLPAVGRLSPGFDPVMLNGKIKQLENDTLATWTDSYNEGQVMNRLIQTARIAHETGAIEARDKMIATIKERLEDWLTYEAGEIAFLFYYQPTWTTLIGYPAGHGQDTNINDHHFHWGYFIHAAAFMEQFEPGWAEKWGGMVDLLIRDSASPDRNDPLFPFLRSFSPYAGHCWANGFASFPFGNDQESSSESMQFNSALIHWGSITGNNAIRDLGIYLYTTEQSAIEEYWLDVHDRTFKDGYGFSLVSRIWGNGYDNQTFWTSDISAAYGIELYPIHGGSLYLGHNLAYAESLWNEMTRKTGILAQAVNDNLWHDVYWQFLSFTDPAAAIALYDANPNRNLKFGISDAQTYYWLHAMNGLGQIDTSVTATDPLAVVFERNGEKTYVAHNYAGTERVIDFSDGFTLTVPAGSMTTSAELPFSGSIETPFTSAPAGNSVPLHVTVRGDATPIVGVEFFDGTASIGTLTEAPFRLQTDALGAGRHTFYAKLHSSDSFSYSGLVTVNVGDTFPMKGTPISLPGTFEPGNYDRYEGGHGQDITYHDGSVGNNGNYRVEEYVDAETNGSEGAIVGWIEGGEWLEYTVDIATTGYYELQIRYASGNTSGGGPFFIELDGRVASAELAVPYTNSWSTFSLATLENIELWEGRHRLRLNFGNGELNIGRLTFTYVKPLNYFPPEADAGDDLSLLDPASTIQLDGSRSTAPSGASLSYFWEQVAGPAVASISNSTFVSPDVSGMDVDGIYRFRLRVDDGSYSDFEDVEILRGDMAQRPPTITILSPVNGSTHIAGKPMAIHLTANDPDGEIQKIELFNGSLHLGTIDASPFTFEWHPPEGVHSLTARAWDSDGLTATSSAVSVTAHPPVPCKRDSANGDFAYEFDSDGEQPTVTFFPKRTGVGSNVLIFYYGTGSGPYPGYPLTPETPFPLSVANGQTIAFYFTYSVPEGGERNTIGENTTYTIGSCADTVEFDMETAYRDWRETHFSTAELADAALEASLWGDFADPDRDSILNLLEFTLGGDPNAIDTGLSWTIDPMSGEWRFRFARRKGLPAGYGLPEWSFNLSEWSTTGVHLNTISFKDGLELQEGSIEVMDTNPQDPVFLRLKATP